MYYSNKKNVLQLVALLKAHGVRKVVLCPGSRNAAIVHTLANVEDFICYPVTLSLIHISEPTRPY